jgi:hypothetical protein
VKPGCNNVLPPKIVGTFIALSDIRLRTYLVLVQVRVKIPACNLLLRLVRQGQCGSRPATVHRPWSDKQLPIGWLLAVRLPYVTSIRKTSSWRSQRSLRLLNQHPAQLKDQLLL